MSRVLSQLPIGEIATVINVGTPTTDDASGHLFRRLAELGFIPGETVRVIRKSFGGEPMAVRVGNSTFALRKYEADHIRVDAMQQQ
jgi:ferrous iron transport protein A